MSVRDFRVVAILACVGLLGAFSQQKASASISFGDVTEFNSSTLLDPVNGIYPVGGSGISNGGFSIDTNASGLQVGLRASQRFFGLLPNDGVAGSATFFSAPGESPTSGSNPTPAPGLAKWNFEFHFDQRGASALDKADSLMLSVDVDPTATTTIQSIDLLDFFPPGNVQLLQGSENLGFSVVGFDPFAAGTYEFTLEALQGATSLASTSMNVTVTPEPTAMLTWAGLATCAFGLSRRRRQPEAQ